ncbi:hypothetical protein FH972_024212 [Carpinus fangiana]|uniref:Glycosyltransferase 2-like domain-containing protein n=1 Tax=Carpinus fangiana TaxID=176857 RepID=A0A5N6KXR7_9ROSI|nr:hypothetical protein FH972_024212 [Carpinus fangiana]
MDKGVALLRLRVMPRGGTCTALSSWSTTMTKPNTSNQLRLADRSEWKIPAPRRVVNNRGHGIRHDEQGFGNVPQRPGGDRPPLVTSDPTFSQKLLTPTRTRTNAVSSFPAPERDEHNIPQEQNAFPKEKKTKPWLWVSSSWRGQVISPVMRLAANERAHSWTRVFVPTAPPAVMGFSLHWLLRCLPALSGLCIVLLSLTAFTGFPSNVLGSLGAGVGRVSRHRQADQWTVAQALWCFYTVVLHLLTWQYNIRLIWAMIRITSKIKRAADSDVKNEGGEKQAEGEAGIMHVLMLPAYREDIDTLQETLDVFASHNLAASNYYVYLAMEEKDPNGVSVANDLLPRYAGRFKDIMYTVHPGDIPGEAPGKSSNISWAAKHAVQRFAGHPSRQNIILTVMDADTHLMNNYFKQVNQTHLRSPDEANSTIFAPPIVFDRNSHKVPAFVRMADLLWSSATISGLFPGSVIGTPTSVYSVPLPLVERVQGWDVDPGAIGEDLHMMIKCFFRTGGTLVTKPIYSPASQCNVCSDLHGLRGYLDSLRARWRQAIRHMWGSLDTGYAYERGLELVHEAREAKISSGSLPYSEPKRHEQRPILTWVSFWQRFLPLYHRLFEAHILPIHITSALLLSTLYSFFVPAVVTPFMLSWAFNVTGVMRFLAFLMMVAALMLYERYHALCVGLRERAVRRSGLHYDADTFSKRTSWLYAMDYVMFPVGGIIFGSLPAVVAQVCHLWTDRLVYHVSAKPKRIVLTDSGVLLMVDNGRDELVVDEKLGFSDVDVQSVGSRLNRLKDRHTRRSMNSSGDSQRAEETHDPAKEIHERNASEYPPDLKVWRRQIIEPTPTLALAESLWRVDQGPNVDANSTPLALAGARIGCTRSQGRAHACGNTVDAVSLELQSKRNLSNRTCKMSRQGRALPMLDTAIPPRYYSPSTSSGSRDSSESKSPLLARYRLDDRLADNEDGDDYSFRGLVRALRDVFSISTRPVEMDPESRDVRGISEKHDSRRRSTSSRHVRRSCFSGTSKGRYIKLAIQLTSLALFASAVYNLIARCPQFFSFETLASINPHPLPQFHAPPAEKSTWSPQQDSFDYILPVPCHSHNDYTRRTPLLDALHAGCISVEADVWLFDADLYVGHTRNTLTPAATLSTLYIDPLLHLLDAANAAHPPTNASNPAAPPPRGLFAADPARSLTLLIDLKTAAAPTFAAVRAALAPLRARGYLSHWNGRQRVLRPLTVVVSGSATLAVVTAPDPSSPTRDSIARDVFLDAPLGALRTPDDPPAGSASAAVEGAAQPQPFIRDLLRYTYNPSNSYYASAKLASRVGLLGQFRVGEAEAAVVRGEIAEARARGLVARYWGQPGWPGGLRERTWGVLVREGVGMLNVDSFEAVRGFVARLGG